MKKFIAFLSTDQWQIIIKKKEKSWPDQLWNICVNKLSVPESNSSQFTMSLQPVGPLAAFNPGITIGRGKPSASAPPPNRIPFWIQSCACWPSEVKLPSELTSWSHGCTKMDCIWLHMPLQSPLSLCPTTTFDADPLANIATVANIATLAENLFQVVLFMQYVCRNRFLD